MAKKRTKKQGVIKSAQKLDIRLLIAVAVAVAVAGGFMVFKSYAVSYSYKRPINTKCPDAFPLHQNIGKYSFTCAKYVYYNDSHVSTKRAHPSYYGCPSGYYRNSDGGVVVNCRRPK